MWRNYLKSFSERKRDATPAMRLGIVDRRLSLGEVLAHRLFPSRIPVPRRWMDYYARKVTTRRLPTGVTHALKYAF